MKHFFTFPVLLTGLRHPAQQLCGLADAGLDLAQAARPDQPPGQIARPEIKHAVRPPGDFIETLDGPVTVENHRATRAAARPVRAPGPPCSQPFSAANS
ncbi:MAG: hypothetical protein MZV64_34570 [Ignavibacteriales bacterium]|nr:hypothetical protein [Ignavibacteriales bacterium]